MSKNTREYLALCRAPAVMPVNEQIGENGTITPKTAQRLISAVVSQAYGDCMEAVRFVFDTEANHLRMNYFGPTNASVKQWWSMTPPPDHCYLGILQWFMINLVFKSIHPMIGNVEARLGQESINVQVRIGSLTEINLEWGATGRGERSHVDA